MSAANRINRFFYHMVNGTLTERLSDEWRQYIRNRHSARWQKQAGKGESLIFQLQTGIRMRLYFDSILSQKIYCGDFEWKERQFLNDYLRHGDIFVDIGANIGLFTLIASYCVGEKGFVYSIEPCSQAFRRLTENIVLNQMNNVECCQIALSDHPGQVAMNVSLDGYDAWNSIVKPIAGQSFTVEMVRALKLDDFILDHHLMGRVTLMKIDVEGWESHVLLGCTETFKRPDAPVLQVEFTDQASQSAGTSCRELYRQLEELGYQMYIYEAKSKRIIPYPMRDTYPNFNLFAIKYTEEVNNRLNKQSFIKWK